MMDETGIIMSKVNMKMKMALLIMGNFFMAHLVDVEQMQRNGENGHKND
jgi:hypothetical protein